MGSRGASRPGVTGRMSQEEMEREHPLELARLEETPPDTPGGSATPPP